MGNICTSNEEKFEATETVDYKNSLKLSVILGKNCSIDLITGTTSLNKEILGNISQTVSSLLLKIHLLKIVILSDSIPVNHKKSPKS